MERRLDSPLCLFVLRLGKTRFIFVGARNHSLNPWLSFILRPQALKDEISEGKVSVCSYHPLTTRDEQRFR